MRSKERKKSLGEVFTPLDLVEKMLSHLPQDVWSDPSKIIGDITGCGNGNFLVAVVRRRLEAGLTPVQVLSTTFGIDIMEDNIKECRRRLLKECCSHLQIDPRKSPVPREWLILVKKNIVCGDALIYDWEKHSI